VAKFYSRQTVACAKSFRVEVLQRPGGRPGVAGGWDAGGVSLGAGGVRVSSSACAYAPASPSMVARLLMPSRGADDALPGRRGRGTNPGSPPSGGGCNRSGDYLVRMFFLNSHGYSCTYCQTPIRLNLA